MLFDAYSVESDENQSEEMTYFIGTVEVNRSIPPDER